MSILPASAKTFMTECLAHWRVVVPIECCTRSPRWIGPNRRLRCAGPCKVGGGLEGRDQGNHRREDHRRVALVLASVIGNVKAQCTQTPGAGNIIGPFSDSFGLVPTNWQRTLAVSQFDRGCGTLNSVSIEFFGNVSGVAAYESLEANPFVITLNLGAVIEMRRSTASGGAVLFTVNPVRSQVSNAGPYDTVLDFGGVSGATFPGLAASRTNSTTLTTNIGEFTSAVAGTVGQFPERQYKHCCALVEYYTRQQFSYCCELNCKAPTVVAGESPNTPGRTCYLPMCCNYRDYAVTMQACCAELEPDPIGNPWCPPSIRSDPHFIAGNGLAYDFMGYPGETYCMFSDKTLHMNMHMIGGVIEGGVAEYRVSNLLAADCHVSQFLGSKLGWSRNAAVETVFARSWVGEAGGNSYDDEDDLADDE
eukprot:jgi/Mesvir1/15652/Mv03257-RA.1